MNLTTVDILAVILPATLIVGTLLTWGVSDLYIIFVIRKTDPTFPTITRRIQSLDKGIAFLIGLCFGLLAGHFFLCG